MSDPLSEAREYTMRLFTAAQMESNDAMDDRDKLLATLDSLEKELSETKDHVIETATEGAVRILKLEAENGRLREALETIGGTDEGQMLFGGIIRTALTSITDPEGGENK